jgi:iron complex outermembrane receptor protein
MTINTTVPMAKGHLALLLASSMLVSLTAGTAALAQAAPQPVAAGNNLLGEVVVTATRQADTVNRVPLTIQAATQATLDQQGVKKIDDLARITPALSVSRAANTGDVTIAIRGINSTVAGTSPTAGVYLDDVPLTKRSAGTGFQVGLNGPPIPQIFDLERVEVLFGPQGTLYGGSSEGGNIRFITPAPSLTRYSSYARGEISTTEHGSASYEGGVAVGGPIVPDKLGFRASVWARHTGGYIDHIDLYTAQTLASDTNFVNDKTIRAALLWAPTDRIQITPSVFWSFDRANDVDVSWLAIPQYFTKTFTVNPPTTVNGVPISTITAPGIPTTQRAWTFQGFTDGPYNQYGPYTSGTNYDPTTTGVGARTGGTPRTTRVFVPSITFDYDLGALSLHNSLAYIQDRTSGDQFGRVSNSTVISNTELNQANTGDCGLVTNNQVAALTLTNGCYPLRLPGFPGVYQDFVTYNHHRAVIEELRLTSKPDSGPLSYVVGLYYSNQGIHAVQQVYNNTLDAFSALTGGNYEPFITTVQNLAPYNQTGLTDATLKETEVAAYTEVNYQITSKLKVIGGIRFTRDTFNYFQQTGGQVTGAPVGYAAPAGPANAANPFPNKLSACPARIEDFNPLNAANGCPYTYTIASTTESPVTPKVGLSYQASSDQLYYVTAAKGYRPGGINPPISPTLCAASFATLGITSTPLQFSSDSLWNYEAGAKIRLFRRAQLNTSLFYIKWNNLPASISVGPPCNRSYTANAASAVSKGFSSQFQWRIVGGLTVSGTIGYTDAYYTADLRSPFPNAPRILTDGEPLPGNSKWQTSLTAQYDFNVMDMPVYGRVDYQYKSHYYNGPAQTDANYQAINRIQPPTNYVSARAGVKYRGADINVFVNNLTNSKDPLVKTESGSSALITAVFFRPREIGLQVAFRH